MYHSKACEGHCSFAYFIFVVSDTGILGKLSSDSLINYKAIPHWLGDCLCHVSDGSFFTAKGSVKKRIDYFVIGSCDCFFCNSLDCAHALAL